MPIYNPSGSGSGDTNPMLVVATDSSGDYQTDGTADEVQIQAAIDAANSAGGGVVLIKEGTYTTNAIITIKSNVILEGQGKGTIITLNNTASVSDIITFSSATYAGVRNLSVDGNAENNAGTNNGINVSGSNNFCENCIVHDIGKNGILTYDGNYNRISGCTVMRCARRNVADNIILYDTNNIVENCIAYDNYDALGNCFGIYSESTGTANNEAQDNIISNCIAYLSGGWGSANVNGFNVEGGIRLTMTNCQAHDCEYGLNILDSSATGNEPIRDLMVSNSSFSNNVKTGIRVDDGDRISIIGCLVRDNGEDGIYIQGLGAVNDLVISGCLIEGNTGTGIDTYASYAGENWIISNCVVKNNTVRGTSLAGATNIAVNNCVFEDNGTRGIDIATSKVQVNGCIVNNNTEEGIQLYSGTQHMVNGCRIVGNGNHGIFVGVSEAIISNNYIDANSTIGTDYDGIRIAGSKTDLSFVGNIITDTQGTPTQQYAMEFSSGSDYVMITGNNLRGNKTGAINGTLGGNSVNTNNIT